MCGKNAVKAFACYFDSGVQYKSALTSLQIRSTLPTLLCLLDQLPANLSRRTHLLPHLLRLFTTRLSHRVPTRNALKDDAVSEHCECDTPSQLSTRVPASYFGIPSNCFATCWQPMCLRRSVEKAVIVQGTMRFERSERGWPIVDISQLSYSVSFDPASM
jgi:hypothetical protein